MCLQYNTLPHCTCCETKCCNCFSNLSCFWSSSSFDIFTYSKSSESNAFLNASCSSGNVKFRHVEALFLFTHNLCNSLVWTLIVVFVRKKKSHIIFFSSSFTSNNRSNVFLPFVNIFRLNLFCNVAILHISSKSNWFTILSCKSSGREFHPMIIFFFCYKTQRTPANRTGKKIAFLVFLKVKRTWIKGFFFLHFIFLFGLFFVFV